MSVLVNSRAPIELHRCQLCDDCTTNRERHLDEEHPIEAVIWRQERADIAIFFCEARS